MVRAIPRSLGLVLLVPLTLACIWDQDTLRMETSEFPTSLDLITGKFRRHSDEYYRWRIQDRTTKLAGDPDNLVLIDDLAVAHDKLGEHDTAVSRMSRSLELSPGRYESLANRGTFRIHGGDFPRGLEDIRAAIAVNPDAHFGREIVQQRLVEYILRERNAGRGNLPLTEPGFGEGAEFGFERFRGDLDPPLERSDAIRGLLGMMRFGHHDHPILLDVLGETLHAEGHKRLAARAYLKASYETEDADLRQEYRRRAKAALNTQTSAPKTYVNITIEKIETAFRDELAAAEQYFAAIRENERRWIDAGADVDAKYAELYYDENSSDPPPPVSSLFLLGAALGFAAILYRKN